MATAKSVIHYSAHPARNIWEIMEGNEIHIYLKVVRQLLCLTNVLYHYCCHVCLLHSTSLLILALKIQHLDFHSARSTTGSTLTYKIPMNKRSSWTSACLLNTGKLLGERYKKLCQSIILQIAMHSFIFRKLIWKKKNKTACKFTVSVSCYQR